MRRPILFVLVACVSWSTGCNQNEPINRSKGSNLVAKVNSNTMSGIAEWRIDPTKRVGDKGQPLHVRFVKQSIVGNVVHATLEVRTLIPGKTLTVELKTPKYAVLIQGRSYHSLVNPVPHKKYLFDYSIKVEAAKLLSPIIASVNFPFLPVSNFHVSAVLPLPNSKKMKGRNVKFGTVSGVPLRMIKLPESAVHAKSVGTKLPD